MLSNLPHSGLTIKMSLFENNNSNKNFQPYYATLNVLSALNENITIYHDNMIDQVMSFLHGLFLCNHLCRGLVSEQKKSCGCFCDPELEFHDIRNKMLNFGFSTRFRFTLTSRLRFIPQPLTLKDVSEMKKQHGIKMYSLCLCCEVYGCTFPSRHSSVD